MKWSEANGFKGYQVETCIGQSGCPNRAVSWDDLPRQIEARLGQSNLKSFLKERVAGPLKPHHQFRVSIADCPNACSRPQIADLGLIGARQPEVSDTPCSQCGACVEVCREGAISLREAGVAVDVSKCLHCGQCLNVCPTGTLREAARGYRIQVGGKLGRHPRLAMELPGIHGPTEALRIVDRCLDHYQRYSRRGERFGEVLERAGLGGLIVEEEENGRTSQ